MSVVIIVDAPGSHGKCELCGKEDELRPYDPNDENICYDCGMKNLQTTTDKAFHHIEKKIAEIESEDETKH